MSFFVWLEMGINFNVAWLETEQLNPIWLKKTTLCRAAVLDMRKYDCYLCNYDHSKEPLPHVWHEGKR
jgi:hypothetical protein